MDAWIIEDRDGELIVTGSPEDGGVPPEPGYVMVVSLADVAKALRATRHRPLITAALHIEREWLSLTPNAR